MFHRDVAKGIHRIGEHFLNFYLIEEADRITSTRSVETEST